MNPTKAHGSCVKLKFNKNIPSTEMEYLEKILPKCTKSKWLKIIQFNRTNYFVEILLNGRAIGLFGAE